MRSKHGNYTPREAAYTIALGWLDAAYHEWTNDIDQFDGPPAFDRALKEQLVKLHDQLLEQSGLDGTSLDMTRG